MNNFKIVQQLGTGSFGKVYSAQHIPTLDFVAIKIIKKQKLKSKEDLQMINKQIAVFKSVQHCNIIRLFEIIEDEANLYLVMQYADGGDLLNYIKNKGVLQEQKALTVMSKLVDVLTYLHQQKKIAHRDIKLANILLISKNIDVKLADFGLSNFYQNFQSQLRTSCGSPCYSAPQILIGSKYNPAAADVWSLGVVFYAIVQGCLPFYNQNVKQLYKQVIKGKYCQHEKASLQIKKLIKRMLETNPQLRITLKDLKKDISKIYNQKYQFNKQCRIPCLSLQSNQYVNSLRAQKIIRILQSKGFEINEANSALQYRKYNLRAKKFNHLNTYIQLLQRKSLGNLSDIIKALEEDSRKREQTKQTFLKNIQSTTTVSLKGSHTLSNNSKARFMRDSKVRPKTSKINEDTLINADNRYLPNSNFQKIGEKLTNCSLDKNIKSIRHEKPYILNKMNKVNGNEQIKYCKLQKQNMISPKQKQVAIKHKHNLSLSLSYRENGVSQIPTVNTSKNNQFTNVFNENMTKRSDNQQNQIQIYRGSFNIMHTYNGCVQAGKLLQLLKTNFSDLCHEGGLKCKFKCKQLLKEFRLQIMQAQNFSNLKVIKIQPFHAKVLCQVKQMLYKSIR